MARILFATVSVVGHINPLLPLAQGLVARGHEVRWLSGKKYAARIAATGATHAPFEKTRDWDDGNVDGEFPGRTAFKGIDQLKFDIKHVFVDQGPGQLADLEALTDAWKPDAVVGDPAMFGAFMLHEKRGFPVAIVGIVPYTSRSRDTAPFGLGLPPSATPLGRVRNAFLNQLVERVIFRGVHAYWARMRAGLGLPTTRFMFDSAKNANLFLMPTVPGFEYPRSDLAANVRFIGALPAPVPKEVERPAWFAELDGSKPVVHVSQGTVANAKADLFAPAIEALKDEDVLVVIATGGRPREALGLVDVPANVRVASFLSYPELLPRTAVMLTNGGYGGVQMALGHGVPLIVAGTTEDKPEVAARVAWSGAGLNLKTSTPTPEAVRAAVREILGNPRYRERAKALAREYAERDAVALGVGHIESMVGG